MSLFGCSAVSWRLGHEHSALSLCEFRWDTRTAQAGRLWFWLRSEVIWMCCASCWRALTGAAPPAATSRERAGARQCSRAWLQQPAWATQRSATRFTSLNSLCVIKEYRFHWGVLVFHTDGVFFTGSPWRRWGERAETWDQHLWQFVGRDRYNQTHSSDSVLKQVYFCGWNNS